MILKLEWGCHFQWGGHAGLTEDVAFEQSLERGNCVDCWRNSVTTKGTRASAKVLR